jgi:thymidylate synthase
MYRFENLDQALIGMSKELLRVGVKRKTRGFDCIEMPNPILICIENPHDRFVTIKERKWNKMLPFVESLWILLGINDLDSLPGNYVNNLYNFSDNGKTWRAGYGPRIRAFSGLKNDYCISEPEHRNIFSGQVGVVDQLKFVVECFKRDPQSRQAVITISDPAKDCFETDGSLKITKDQPCSRSLHFQMNIYGQLDIIVDIRSNDILWGFSAVNVCNFSIIQEVVARILNVPVGKYYHKADNFHFYENFRDKIVEFSELDLDKYSDKFNDNVSFGYKDSICCIEDLDIFLALLYKYEKRLRIEGFKEECNFGNDMINDWGKVLYQHWTNNKVRFNSYYLNKLFYGN